MGARALYQGLVSVRFRVARLFRVTRYFNHIRQMVIYKMIKKYQKYIIPDMKIMDKYKISDAKTIYVSVTSLENAQCCINEDIVAESDDSFCVLLNFIYTVMIKGKLISEILTEVYYCA